MKRGNELGIRPIQSNNMPSTEGLRELHIELNAVLFKYSLRYISRLDSEVILSRLTDIGKRISSLDAGDKGKARKDNLLKETRAIWRNVHAYQLQFKWSKFDVPQIQSAIKFQVVKLMDAKKDSTLYTEPVKYLDSIKEIYDNMVIDSGFKGELKLDTLLDFNQELLDILLEKYSISRN